MLEEPISLCFYLALSLIGLDLSRSHQVLRLDAFLSIIGQKHVWPVSCLSILVKILSVVEQYLMLRQMWLACHKVKSDALFFAMGGDHSFMSDNTSGGSGARSKRPSGRSSSSGIVEGPSASTISTRASNSPRCPSSWATTAPRPQSSTIVESAKLKPSKTPERSGERRVRRKDLIVLEDQGIE